MIHISDNYNRRIQDSENLIPDAEPVFLLRGQDKHAPGVISYWADRVANAGNYDLAIKATGHMKLMLEWQRDHGAKEPDEPACASLRAERGNLIP